MDWISLSEKKSAGEGRRWYCTLVARVLLIASRFGRRKSWVISKVTTTPRSAQIVYIDSLGDRIESYVGETSLEQLKSDKSKNFIVQRFTTRITVYSSLLLHFHPRVRHHNPMVSLCYGRRPRRTIPYRISRYRNEVLACQDTIEQPERIVVPCEAIP